MPRAISRRAWIAGTGGILSASLGWGLWKLGPWTRPPADPNPVAACCAFADFAGWIVTTADKEKLMVQDAPAPR